MLIYILKSSAILAVLLLFYKLFLEKENIHVFKRHFLLASILLAIGIPSITFTKYIEAQPIFEPVMTEVIDGNFEIVSQEPPVDYTSIILWSIYGLGVLFFSIRFLINLTKIGLRIKNNPKLKNNGIVNVLIQDLVTPHTFFSYIFFNKYAFEAKKIPSEVKIHEETHAKQLHSLDIIILELLQIVFWFNPLIYLLKNYVKLNHEFLADKAVLKSGTALKEYQKTLLAYTHNYYSIHYSSNSLSNELLSNKFGQIKKRFTIMKTKKSSKKTWLKSALLLPLLAMLIYGFSTKQIVEKQLETQNNIQKDIITTTKNKNEGATEEMMKEYRAFIKKVEETKFINGNKINRIIAIYDIMTPEQRKTVKKYPKTMPFNNLSKVKPIQPSMTEYNSWKNKTKFAVWIDGKHVDNSVLNQYRPKDIKYYSSSFVHNNARSKKFPQPYQNSLYTKKGFEENYLKNGVKKYNKLKKRYQKAINDDNIKASELKILKAQVNRAYKSLSEQEIKKYNVVKVTETLQTKATPEQLKTYNKWAKTLNNEKLGDRIVKLKDYNKYKKIYDSMSPSQKKGAQPFPTFPPPPPPPPSRKFDIEKASDKLKERYNQYKNKAETYAKNVRKYRKTKKGHDELYKQYNEVMELHKEVRKLSFKEGLVIPPPPPPIPAKSIKKNKGKKTAYKVINDNNKQTQQVKDKNQQKTKKGWVTYGNETLYYIEKNKKKSYYNRFGKQVYPMTITGGPSAGDDFIITIDYDDKRIKVPQPPKKQSKNGWIFINNTKYYHAIIDGKKQYYDRWGNKVNLTDKELNQEPVTIDKIDKLTNEQILKLPKDKNAIYYINGKKASKKQVDKLNVKKIKEIKVKRSDKKNTREIYITTK